jgi:hypothetical protein
LRFGCHDQLSRRERINLAHDVGTQYVDPADRSVKFPGQKANKPVQIEMR